MNVPDHPTRADASALPITALDYELPVEHIATHPVEPRDTARMLVVHRRRDEIEHRRVRDLPDYLESADTIVFNRTMVQRARIVGRRTDSGGRVEGLVLVSSRAGDDAECEAMLKSNGRLRIDQRIELDDRAGQPSGRVLCLVERRGDRWQLRLESAGSFDDALTACGRTPLPPYILRARGAQSCDDDLDRRRYQTVFATGAAQSVAAPTAGLHFTPELLGRLERTGAERLEVLLHVGPGTFQPVTATTLAEHVMHHEWFEVDAPTIDALRDGAGRPGHRLFAVGTTSVRALESLPHPLPNPGRVIQGETDLLISPPYDFRLVDGLLTNFHLPRSTLLALVAALVGLDRLLAIYREAIEHEYRFYSYGDAMLILP